MTSPLPDSDEKQEDAAEFVFGPYVGPEGGVWDNTIRPSRRPRRPENGQDTPGGPDLTDWLNRTFDD
jgi:hypothetical protein